MAGQGGDKLFIYGALLDASERSRLLARTISVESAHLDGYTRGRKRYFFVSRCEGARVEGAILSGLLPGDFLILDAYEEVPTLYTRESTEAINFRGKKVRCWIYLPTGWERK